MTLSSISQTIGYIVTICSFLLALIKIYKKIHDIAAGQTCLLRNSITNMYYKHSDEADPALREYERKNLDDLYIGYKSLGGNHFVDDLYESMRDWKVQK